ncbi:hypothetical protein [Nesterenkonia haasae]|uniref:hypothetical protein n=1 Tax=Nesterenkonia haasae TaxID=2587813 RepID=UPI001391B3B3|nr:hypothetical protein [Nesterenkonia haasae]NDK32439.1 hypothetical protein [Nesterenkonia haasae]
MVDVWAEGVPNWIMAGSTLFTAGVASVAAFFAYRAANWTKKQAEASQDQVENARKALEVAHQDAEVAKATSESQRAEADRSHRLLVQAQLDALAPVVLAKASPTDQTPPGRHFFLWMRRDTRSSGGNLGAWKAVTEKLELPREEKYRFKFSVHLAFENVSDAVARVDILDTTGGKFPDFREGTMPFTVVPPHEERGIVWTREWSSDGLLREGVPFDPMNESFHIRFEVRDQGLNVCDTYEFLTRLGFFSRDGSRLIVKPRRTFPNDEGVATPVPGRRYERLDD